MGVWQLRQVGLTPATENMAMQVWRDGTAHLIRVDDGHPCRWRPADPVYRGITGSGRTFVAQRYNGPCSSPPTDWFYAELSLSEDLLTLTERAQGLGRVWVKLS